MKFLPVAQLRKFGAPLRLKIDTAHIPLKEECPHSKLRTKEQSTMSIRLLAAAMIILGTQAAGAVPFSRSDACRGYGYVPGTRAFAECRVNVRIYWSTGPCSNAEFAAVHRRYCHIVPEIDF
jgi:hypothetical protein